MKWKNKYIQHLVFDSKNKYHCANQNCFVDKLHLIASCFSRSRERKRSGTEDASPKYSPLDSGSKNVRRENESLKRQLWWVHLFLNFLLCCSVLTCISFQRILLACCWLSCFQIGSSLSGSMETNAWKGLQFCLSRS